MQINQYANTATSVTDADWLDLDKNMGGGVWKSQKLSLPVLMDSMSTLDPNFGANIGNTDLTITDATRTLNLDGKKLVFLNNAENGQVRIGNFDPSTTAYNLIVASTGAGGAPASGGLFVALGAGTGISGTSSSGIGISGTASSSGSAIKGTATDVSSTTAKAGDFSGRVHVYEAGTTPTVENKLILDVVSNKKGSRPVPTMTTAERYAEIPTPPAFTQIINGTTGLPEYYHPTFGWVGMAERSVFVQCLASNYPTGTDWHFGNIPVSVTSNITGKQFKSPFTGKITKCHVRCIIGGTIGDRKINVYVMVDGTPYLVQSITATLNINFINTSMNTTGIPVVEGVSEIAIRVTTTGGTTDPTSVIFGGTVTIQ